MKFRGLVSKRSTLILGVKSIEGLLIMPLVLRLHYTELTPRNSPCYELDMWFKGSAEVPDIRNGSYGKAIAVGTEKQDVALVIASTDGCHFKAVV